MATAMDKEGNKLNRLNSAFTSTNRLREATAVPGPRFDLDSFTPGQAKPGENPADFAGTWANIVYPIVCTTIRPNEMGS